MMNSPSISAIIITRNEADNLPECLQSLGFCSEIIVVDSNSDDDTQLLAERHGAVVISAQDWPGFGLQKQRALDAAHGDWVLSIDADERIPPGLRSEIISAIQTDRFNGFFIKRRSQFLGKWMKHGGWYPDQVLRLAKRDKAHFNSALLHEKMLVSGAVGELNSPMLHYSYRSIEDVLKKQKNYALAGGAQKLSGGKKGGLFTALTRSVWTFLRLYGLQLGFLDGRHGLIAALAKSQETFWKYLATAWPGDRSR